MEISQIQSVSFIGNQTEKVDKGELVEKDSASYTIWAMTCGQVITS